MGFQTQLLSDKSLYEHLGPVLSHSLAGNTKLTQDRGAAQIAIRAQLQAVKRLQPQLHFSESNHLFHSSADLQLDLRERWPFPDGSVASIYSEHVFEHFEFYREVPHFLSECMRALKTGGAVDIGVPDSDWRLRGYGIQDYDYWKFAATCHPDSCETQLDHINNHFRQGDEHKYAWDEETLTRSFQRAGFVCIARRPFNATLDSESRRIGTLYVRALKP